MLTINEVLILKEISMFAVSKQINISKLAREVGVSRKTVYHVLNKFMECRINEKK